MFKIGKRVKKYGKHALDYVIFKRCTKWKRKNETASSLPKKLV